MDDENDPAIDTVRFRVELQGFLGLDDDTLQRVGPWLRLSPAICAAWTAVGVVAWSPEAILALVPFAALGAVLRTHPFDVLYDRLARPRIDGPRIPRYPLPRRFACSVAALWLLGLAWAMATGPGWVGRFLGIGFVVTALVPALTDFCVPSWMLARWRGHPAERAARRAASDAGHPDAGEPGVPLAPR